MSSKIYFITNILTAVLVVVGVQTQLTIYKVRQKAQRDWYNHAYRYTIRGQKMAFICEC